MDDNPRDPDSERVGVEDLLAEFIDRRRQGEAVEIDDYVRAHPHLAIEIQDVFPMAMALDGWKSRETASAGGTTTLGGVELQQLGDFRLLRRVGRGGMGVVYEAFQESLSRRVAIKILPPLADRSATSDERFRNEAQTLAGLHHPHIVPVFGIGSDESIQYIVMQFIDGASLDRWLLESRPACDSQKVADRIARWGVQAAQGLDYAHQCGTLHRDIKPGNLMIDGKDHLWVTDFGLSKNFENASQSASTDVFGTLMYLAPERFEGRCDRRADIYALGLTLYQLWLGKAPFSETDHAHLVAKIRSGISTLRIVPQDRMQRDLAIVLLKSLAADPADRYQDAGAMAADLQALLDDQPIAARPLSRWQRCVRWGRRNPGLAAMSACSSALLLLTLGLIGIAWHREKQHGEQTAASLQTTLDTLDRVYQRFSLNHVDVAPSGEVIGEDGQGITLVATPAISQETAQLLGELLEMYDRLSHQAIDTQRLDSESIKAQVRVAEIQMRLGNTSQAADAYVAVLGRVAKVVGEDSRWQTTICQVLLDLADAYQLMGQMQDADQSRYLALHRAEGLPDDGSKQRQVLLARAHFDLGKQRQSLRWLDLLPSHGRGTARRSDPPPQRIFDEILGELTRDALLQTMQARDGEKHLQQAIEILDAILVEEPDHATAASLLARCHLEWGKYLPANERQSHESRALEILESLATGGGDSLRFELGNAYAQQSASRMLVADNLPAAIDGQERAIEEFDRLVQAQPNVPQYVFAAAVAKSKLAGYLIAFQQQYRGFAGPQVFDDAADLLAQSIEKLDLLHDRFPDQTQYALWLAKLKMEDAKVRWIDGQHQAAETRLQEVDRLLQPLAKQPAVADLVALLQSEARAIEHHKPMPPSPPQWRRDNAIER